MKNKILGFFSELFSLIKRKRKLIIISVLVLVAVFGTYAYVKNKNSKSSMATTEYTVRRKNIDVVVSGTGSVTSCYRQDISSNAVGTVTKVYFKEGDKVKQGDFLFQLDDSSAASTVERTRLSLEQSKADLQTANSNIKNLSVTSPISGQISNVTVIKGDSVNKGQEICTITDTAHMKVTVPFNGFQAQDFRIGDEAIVYLQDYMDTVTGRVTYVSNSGRVVSGGGTTYDVEVSFNNPGALKAGSKASAQIRGIMSGDSAAIAYQDAQKVRAQVSGTVSSLNIRDSQYVNSGQELISLTNDDLKTQVLSSQVKVQDLVAQLNSQIKSQSDYKLYSYSDGTIVSQDIKVGDVVKANDVLATISNPDAMEFSISVDELDIAKIKLGLNATITVDALTGKTFTGVVSKIAQVGTSSSGVTTYPVTVIINNPVDIKEGMNASANIIIEHKENVLTLSSSAVQKSQRGSYVFVKETAVAGTTSSAETQQNGSAASQSQANGSNKSTSQTAKNSNSQANRLKEFGLTMKTIQVGINNDSDIEIVSGLNEGDKVYVITSTKSTITSSQSSGFGMGGMGGGGMPPMDMGGSGQNRSSNRSSNSSSSSSSQGGAKSGN